jgi:hypothetical protein
MTEQGDTTVLDSKPERRANKEERNGTERRGVY